MSDLLKKEISLKSLFKRKSATASSLDDAPALDEAQEGEQHAVEVPVVKFTPRTPEINIIPAYVLEDYKTAAIRNKFIAVAATLALGFAGLFVYQAVSASQHEQSLDALNARTSELNAEVRQLKVYEQYQQGVLDKRTAIGTTMNTDIALGQIAEALNTAASANGVTITGMSISVNSDPTSGSGECVNPDPFTTTSSVGCVTFTGTASGRGAVEGFLRELENTNGLVIPYIPNYVSGEGEGGNAISGSVAFTEEFQSQRFAELLVPYGQEAPADTEGALNEGEEVNP